MKSELSSRVAIRCIGNYILDASANRTILSLLYIMERYFKPVAAIVAHELNLFTHLEGLMADWDGNKQVNSEMFGWIKERAEGAEKIVSDLNLNMSRTKAGMLSHCIAQQVTQVEDLRNRMREVRETIIQELSSINFLRATDDIETYLDKPMPFGADVSSVFS